MRPSAVDLIDILHRTLPGVVAVPGGFLSESALAEVLGVDRRWLRGLRSAGISAPRSFGRGFLYSGDDARVCAVARRLIALGFTVAEIARFLAGPCDPATCPTDGRACSPRDCCEQLLAGHARRLTADIGELQRFQHGLTAPAATEGDPAAD